MWTNSASRSYLIGPIDGKVEQLTILEAHEGNAVAPSQKLAVSGARNGLDLESVIADLFA